MDTRQQTEKTMARKPESESFMDMFSTLGRDLKLPSVDIDAILEHNRKNIEALQRSASATAAGASSVMAKQREIIQEAVREITEMAQGFGANPRDAVTKQADFVKRSFESAVKNSAEMAEMIQKSGTESVDILRQRIRESMDEIRKGIEKDK